MGRRPLIHSKKHTPIQRSAFGHYEYCEFWIVVIGDDSVKTYERGQEVYSVMNFNIKVDDVFRY